MESDKYILLSVPLDMLADAGISENKIVQISATGGKIIIEAVTDTEEFVCGGDCDNCPINKEDCDRDCEHCPCAYLCDNSEVI